MEKQFIFFEHKELEKDIGEIKPDLVKPFWSNGKWSMHDLLLYLVKLSGPAKVWLSTFSISEIAIRAFSHALETGLITELHCLFDYTVKTHKLSLLYFAGNIVSDIRLVPNHSKVILIENNDWKITVISSANMSPNPRIEAGVIIVDDNIYNDFKTRLVNTMMNAHPLTFE